MSMHTSLRRTAATIPSTTTTILPSRLPTSLSKATTFICSQCRHATLLRRPKRPYTFTQLITLTDGSAFTLRTTSPAPVYRSTRDTRNSLLWNPSSSKLMNVEEDEAGRLAAFRARFGRSWDASAPAEAAEAAPKDSADAKAKEEAARAQAQAEQEEEDNLLDLISSFGQEENQGSGKKKN
ncbi:hypothetical protein N7532_011768 [Penicillium argentinense]|uniref:Ribosomal protein bL31m N-terminal domain-containing protein n=1 Tax=Penicillium argentinense TaxID=1131581 RepID=A0A9W9JV98_9EURO|nr:uncharacterized protein N7532_011768 [Penicillium argentinense]KAJ5082725.1 hypothetical protein N7532_011768 [Penicillium argentinense]